jgi:hypothetical protein
MKSTQPEGYGWIADDVSEFDDFYPEYGTAVSHWTESTKEEIKRNPIGFIWQT